jgi:predicted DNA-binding ribbon-helix-helix protein
MAAKKEVETPDSPRLVVERVQTGIRLEKRMLKVLKGLAEYLDMSVGDLLEGIVLHAFENKTPFSPEILQRIAQLKEVYGMDYGSEMSHRLTEQSDEE